MKTLLALIIAVAAFSRVADAQPVETIVNEPRLGIAEEITTGAQLRTLAAEWITSDTNRSTVDSRNSAGIQKRTKDSLKNGAWLGAAVGAGIGAGLVPIVCRHSSERNDCRRAYSVLLIPILAGGGAIAGSLIDRAIEDDPVIVQVTTRRMTMRARATIVPRQQRLSLTMAF